MFAMRWAHERSSDVCICSLVTPVFVSWLTECVGLLRACELLEPEYLVHMLKAIKHLSMNATLLEVLQNANAIEILTRILDEQSTGLHSTVGYDDFALYAAVYDNTYIRF